MKFIFTVEYLVRERVCLEVEAAAFEEACEKYGRLREEGERGEAVDSNIVDGGDLVQVEDEKGTLYDAQKAEELAWSDE